MDTRLGFGTSCLFSGVVVVVVTITRLLVLDIIRFDDDDDDVLEILSLFLFFLRLDDLDCGGYSRSLLLLDDDDVITRDVLLDRLLP